jgi:hypothetical protein
MVGLKMVHIFLIFIWGCPLQFFLQLLSRLFVAKPAQSQPTNLHRVFHFHPPAFVLQIFPLALLLAKYGTVFMREKFKSALFNATINAN